MQILFISERFPWPLEDGGNMRTFHVLKAICQKHDVTLLSHAPLESTDKAIRELAKICRVETVAAPSLLTTAFGVLLRPWRWRESLFVLKNWSSSLFQKSQALLTLNQYDAVHFNHLDTAAFIAKSNWPKSVFDSHNCISSMAEQLANDQSSRWQKLPYQREAKALAATENNVCARCDIVFACSQQDRNSFLRLSPSANIKVVPNGVAITNRSSTQQTFFHNGKFPKLVFTGAMDYAPNIVGVEWFCKHVLPIIRQQQPHVLFQIVGRNPTDRVASLHDVELVAGEKVGTEVTGRVESVAPYLNKASVVVVPLLDGGGTRLKILEAFAAKRPVVSTVKGAEGIDAENNSEILIADEPLEFAASVLRLLNDPAEATRLGDAASQLAKRSYDWDSIGQQILDIYETLDATRGNKMPLPNLLTTAITATIETVNR